MQIPLPSLRARWLAIGLTAIITALPAAAFADSMPMPGTTVAAPIVVPVGSRTNAISFDMMFPGATYIHVGDTLAFTNKATETPHTVTFFGGAKPPSPLDPAAAAPSQPSGGSYDGIGLLNSGMLMPGASYSVTFTKAGVYPFACLLHPMMVGTVVVMPADVAIPALDAQAAASMQMQMDADAQSAALVAGYTDRLPSGTKNANGSITWNVTAGIGLSGFDVEQFFPSSLVLSEGDAVTFTNKNMYEPHFVTFLSSPADKAKFFGPMGPNFVAMVTPAGGTTVDGSQLLNAPVFPGQGTTFTFPKAGSYTFYCLLHSGAHMEGTVTVQPKGFVHAYLNDKAFVYSDSVLVHIHNGIVYVPVAEVIKQLGGSVAWDGASQTVTAVTSGTAKATAAVGTGVKVMVNGKLLTYGFDPQPHIHDGHVYVPAQVLVDALGGRLTWDATTTTLGMTVK